MITKLRLSMAASTIAINSFLYAMCCVPIMTWTNLNHYVIVNSSTPQYPIGGTVVIIKF